MGRRAATTAAALLTALMGAIITDGSASAAPVTPASTAGKATPAKVKARSSWTLLPSGFPCETDAFGPHHAFAAFDQAHDDQGRYHGTKTLTMTWRAGDDKGDVFHGTWTRGTGAYTGTDSIDGTNVPASLSPVAATGCALVTTAAQSPSVTEGFPVTDGVTVTGQDGFTPTGIVQFYVCPGDSPCATNAPGVTNLGRATLAPTAGSTVVASATSGSFVPEDTGTFCFLGVYAGNPHYSVSSDSSLSDECFTVTGSGGSL